MTSTPNALDTLKHYAHQVQLSAPKEWDTFLTVFDAYTHETVIAMTNADQSQVLQQQGRAQAYLWLLQALRTCGNPKAPNNQQSPTG